MKLLLKFLNLKKYLISILICTNLTGFEANFLVEHVKKSILNADNNISKLNNEILSIHGLSGHKNRHFLNNLCSLKGGRYLEIGVWKGSTFVAALYENNDSLLEAIAIDNRYLRSVLPVKSPAQEFDKNTSAYLKLNSFKFYEADCFKINLDEIFKDKINIYFYDGEHAFDDHVQAFTYFDSILDNNFIAVVDDYNWQEVQEGTKKAFKDLNYSVVYEQYIPSIYTNWFEEFGWWNGVYIAVISK